SCTLGELLAQKPEKQRGHPMTFVYQREKSSDEEAWLREIQERYALVGHRIAVDDILMTDVWEGAGYWDEPNIEIFSFSIFRAYVEAVRSTGATAVLNGSGGEAVVTSERSVPVHLADLLASLRLPSFFDQLLAWRRGLHVPLLNLLIQAVVLPFLSNRYSLLESKPYEVPEWISPEFSARMEFQRRATGCWGDLKCRSRDRQRRLERLYRVSGFLTRGYLEQAALIRYPFLHQPLVEFALRVPHEYKADPIESRKLLRHGMADVLPEGLRRRLRQPTGNSPLYYALERQWSSFEPALRDPILADLGIIDRSGFEKAMKLARIGHSTNTVIMLSTLALEIWARRIFGVETGKARIA
ncbi:MAG TPA: asparagine synthase-related protein, partial [Thermoanaerobaculia bacterium]|nr:asparagine synthase-related protein [Thermoanaerobaculia bacterium]